MVRLIQRFISSLSNEQKTVSIFFLLLFLTLFLGDGKQQTIDIFIAGYIVLFGFYWFKITKHSFKPLPASITVFWFFALLYTGVLCLFTDSIGYSFYALNRLVIGYVVFHFWYTIATAALAKNFSTVFLWFAMLTILASGFMIVFPDIGASLPLMNLLYQNFGHHYLAYIIVPIIPIVIERIKNADRWTNYLLLLGILTCLLITFARGALLLVALYLLIVILLQRNKFSTKAIIFFISISLIFLGTFLAISNTTIRQKTTPYLNTIIHKFIKQNPPIQNRVIYWQQAMQAFTERPFFGSGPGTFYLQSKRLQQDAFSYSLFAHSYPLETLAELGAIGFLIIFGLQYQIIRVLTSRKIAQDLQKKHYMIPLLSSVGLMLCYSLYEFNMNFVIISILFFSIQGLCLGVLDAKVHNTSQLNAWLPRMAAFFLILFYGVSMLGLGNYVLKAKGIAAWVTPFDKRAVQEYLQSIQTKQTQISESEAHYFSIFSHKDPEILIFLSATTKNADQAVQLAAKAVQLEQTNMEYHVAYATSLALTQNREAFGHELTTLGILQTPEKEQAIQNLHLASNIHAETDMVLLTDIIATKKLHPNTMSILYYLLGYEYLSDDASMTKSFWTLAKDISPKWSFFHVELASLEQYIFHDPQKAHAILVECQQFPDAKRHCMDVYTSGQLPQVGSLKTTIKNIIPQTP